MGAALHSVSVLNVLRSQNLQNTDFRRPDQVLAGLNTVFPMENHKEMYFTIWYGVYNCVSRRFDIRQRQASASPVDRGYTGESSEIRELRTPNLIIGGMAGLDFDCDQVTIKGPARLYVFSDGVYEIMNEDGACWEFDDLKAYLENSGRQGQIDHGRSMGARTANRRLGNS